MHAGLAAAGLMSGMFLGCGGSGESTGSDTDGGVGAGIDGGFLTDDSGPFRGELGDAVCASTTLEGRRAEVAMLFLVDRSGSMNCAPTTDAATCDARPVRPSGGALSKFDMVSASLAEVVASLRDTDRAGFGVFGSDDACSVAPTPMVPVSILSANQRQTMTAAVRGITPKGATPLVGGTTVAFEHLNPNRPGFDLPKRRFLVLVTDGAETCQASSVPAFLSTTVARARSVGIRTFVVGAPGSEAARSMLSEVAFQGGTARSASCSHGALAVTDGDCHVDLSLTGQTFNTALSSALLEASRLAIPCEVELPANLDRNVVDFDRAVVRMVSGQGATSRIDEDRTAGCDDGANGWQYEDGHARVVLCGSACAALRNDRAAKITVELGCLAVGGPTK